MEPEEIVWSDMKIRFEDIDKLAKSHFIVSVQGLKLGIKFLERSYSFAGKQERQRRTEFKCFIKKAV